MEQLRHWALSLSSWRWPWRERQADRKILCRPYSRQIGSSKNLTSTPGHTLRCVESHRSGDVEHDGTAIRASKSRFPLCETTHVRDAYVRIRRWRGFACRGGTHAALREGGWGFVLKRGVFSFYCYPPVMDALCSLLRWKELERRA